MTAVTKFASPVAQTPRNPTNIATAFRYDIAVVSGDCPQNDWIDVFTPPAGAIIVDATLRHDATLGASATAQLRLGTTALSSATSAGAASGVIQNVVPAASLADGTNTLNVLIAGAAIAASTTIRVTGFYVMPN